MRDMKGIHERNTMGVQSASLLGSGERRSRWDDKMN
jgi:hypothetical protein